MAKNQNKRTRVVIHHCRSFRAAQQRKIVFQVRGATAAPSLGESIFKIVVLRSNPGHRFHDGMPQWRTTEIRVNKNAGAIDHRLDAGRAQSSQRGTQLREDFFEARDCSVFAQRSEFPPNGCHDGRVRQSRIAQRMREFVDRWDAAQSGTFHAATLIFGLLERTI